MKIEQQQPFAYARFKDTIPGLNVALQCTAVTGFAHWRSSPTRLRQFVICSVVCLSSVAHHLSGSNWEAAATGTLGRWAYAESKLAMILFAKVRRDQSWDGPPSPWMAAPLALESRSDEMALWDYKNYVHHFELPLFDLFHPFPFLFVFQELRRRFKAAGSTATACAVNPGVVRSDIYRATPKVLMPMFDLFMRVVFLTTDQGCIPSLCASTWPLERLSGEDEGEGGKPRLRRDTRSTVPRALA